MMLFVSACLCGAEISIFACLPQAGISNFFNTKSLFGSGSLRLGEKDEI